MDECPFTPKISNPSPKRNVNQFIEDQRKHEENSKFNLNKLIDEANEREISECQSKPFVSIRSKEIINKTRNNEQIKPAYKRLYYTKIQNNFPSSEKKISPNKKSLINESELVTRLCSDKKSRDRKQTTLETPKKNTTYKNDHYIINK